MSIRWLLALLGVALLVPAPITMLSPDLAASAYGIAVPTPEAKTYLLATATRDVALGVWLLSLLCMGAAPRLLAVSVWSIAIVAIGDAWNVGSHTQWKNLFVLLPHVGGGCLLIITGCWLWRSSAVSKQPQSLERVDC